MNRITAEQAISQIGARKCPTLPLRLEILDLEPGEAVEVNFDEYKHTTVIQVANNLSRRDKSRRYSVRKRNDNAGCFVICKPFEG